MSRFDDLVTKAARDMGCYTPGPPPSEASARLIRLDSNENPFGPSPRAVEAMRSAMVRANSYPDDDCTMLRRKLAALHDVPAEQVLVTAGSTGMLALLCETLLAPGLNAVTSERAFIVYTMLVDATGAQLVKAPMRDDGFDLAAIRAAINDDTQLVFLANPNNPTGTMIEAAAIEDFLHALPKHVVVVLDEAYYEFAAHFAAVRRADYSRALDYVRHGGSVVVLRTFSKAQGLAGLRVGYGLGPAELLSYCARLRHTFSVSSLAEAAALAAMDDHAHVKRTVENNATQADFLTKRLSDFGYRVVPTWANFLYCDVEGDASGFASKLRDEGVSVRPLGIWGVPTCVRITIGKPEDNQRLVDAMGKLRNFPSMRR